MTPAPLRRIGATALMALVAALLTLGLVACGDDDGADAGTATGSTQAAGGAALPTRTNATLVLDFLPNAVHAGIYRAARPRPSAPSSSGPWAV